MNKYVAKYFFYGVGQFIRREPVMKYLYEYEKTQYFDYEKLNNYQLERLENLINYAKENIPYYKNKFQGIEFNKKELRNRLSDFPTITKIDVRDNLASLSAINKPYLLTKIK